MIININVDFSFKGVYNLKVFLCFFLLLSVHRYCSKYLLTSLILVVLCNRSQLSSVIFHDNELFSVNKCTGQKRNIAGFFKNGR